MRNVSLSHVFKISSLLVLLLILSPAAFAEPTLDDATDSVLELPTVQKLHLDDEPEQRYSKWYMHYGAANAYPKIESEKLVRDLFDPLMKFLSPGHDEVLLVSDLRDLGIVWAPQLGVGRVFGEWFSVTMLGSYAGGTVRTKQTNRSIFLLPLHSDFAIARSAAVLDFAFDFYPFKTPKRRDFDNWKDRFRASRPRIGVNPTYVWATYDAKVSIQFVPFPNIGIKLHDKWFIPSYQARIGWDIPIDRRNLLQFNAGYQWFTEEERDFNGAVFSIAWKSFFHARRQD